MEEIKVTVTQEKRQETMDKILQLIEKQFDGIEVTARFTEKLLQDTIEVLKGKAMEAPIKNLNHSIKTKD